MGPWPGQGPRDAGFCYASRVRNRSILIDPSLLFRFLLAGAIFWIGYNLHYATP